VGRASGPVRSTKRECARPEGGRRREGAPRALTAAPPNLTDGRLRRFAFEGAQDVRGPEIRGDGDEPAEDREGESLEVALAHGQGAGGDHDRGGAACLARPGQQGDRGPGAAAASEGQPRQGERCGGGLWADHEVDAPVDPSQVGDRSTAADHRAELAEIELDEAAGAEADGAAGQELALGREHQVDARADLRRARRLGAQLEPGALGCGLSAEMPASGDERGARPELAVVVDRHAVGARRERAEIEVPQRGRRAPGVVRIDADAGD
jgi:hypothetical protein